MGSSGRTPIAVSSCSLTGSVSYSTGRLATTTGSREERPNRLNWLIALTQAMRIAAVGDLVEAVQHEQQLRVGGPAPAQRAGDLVQLVQLLDQPLVQSWAAGRPAGQRQVDRQRVAGIGLGPLGQPAGQLEQQGGLSGAGFAEDQQPVAVQPARSVEGLQQRRARRQPLRLPLRDRQQAVLRPKGSCPAASPGPAGA